MASKFRRSCYRAHWRTAASWLCARAIRDAWDKAEQPSRPRPSYWQAGEQSPSSCVAKPGTSGRARAPGRGQLDLESEQRGFVAHRGRRTMGMAYLQVRTERPHHDEDHSRRTPSQVLRVREATGASMRRHDYAAAARATGEPQLAGYAHTHAVNYDGNATEHANAGSSTDAGRAALQLESDADFRARVDRARATRYVARATGRGYWLRPSGAEPPRCKEKGCQLTRCGFSVFCVQHEVQYRERSTHFRGNFRILQVPLTDLPNGPMGVRAILEFPAGTGPALPQGVQPHHRHILAPIRSGPGAQEAADNDGRSLQAAASIGTPMELTATFETGEESGPFPDPVTGGEQPPEALIESRRRAAVADARAAAAANAAAVAHAAAAAAAAEAGLHPSPAGLGVSPPSATAAAGPQTSPHGTEALSVEAAGSGGNATEHANAGSSSGEWPIVAGSSTDAGRAALQLESDADFRARVDRALAASRAQGEAAQPTGTSTQGIPAPADTGASQSSTSRPLTVLDVDNRTARTSGPDWRPAALCEEGGCLQTRLHGSLYCETHDAARATAYVLRNVLRGKGYWLRPSGAGPPRCREKGAN